MRNLIVNVCAAAAVAMLFASGVSVAQNVGLLPGLSLYGRSANTTGQPGSITAGTDHQVMRRSGTSIGFGAVNLDQSAATTGSLGVDRGGTDATTAAGARTNLGLGTLAVGNSASDVPFTPTGSIAATNTQSAVAEVDSEKQPLDADLTSWAGVTRAAGFDTFVATPSSANLAALMADETGTGALVFGTTPTITIGAATESNIEAAIDTLANLTSIQGFAFDLDDDGFDTLFGWDDSAATYDNFALADITTEATPATGDFVIIYGAEGDLRKVNWSSLPGASSLPGDPGFNAVLGWDDTANQSEWWSPGTGLTASTSTIDCDAATTTAVGCLELATNTEAKAGTDTTRGITPSNLPASVRGPGEFFWFTTATCPTGYSLPTNGAAVSRTTYAPLFAIIGTTYGVGDGSTTFNVPNTDTNNRFVRAADGTTITVGTTQTHQLQSHSHEFNTEQDLGSSAGTESGGGARPAGATVSKQTLTSGSTGTFGTETRPNNIALRGCITF